MDNWGPCSRKVTNPVTGNHIQILPKVRVWSTGKRCFNIDMTFERYMDLVWLILPLEKGKIRHFTWDCLSGLPIIHHDGYTCELPANHPFPMAKFGRIMKVLERDAIVSRAKQVMQPEEIDEECLRLVHADEYLDRFLNGKFTDKEQRVSGFGWSRELVKRVLRETGGTLLTAKIALDRGLACSTAGGTHHAFPDKATGYCLINDLAVTSKYLIDNDFVDKILIIDLDVHQGDGTAAIFHRHPTVFTFSMHCATNFPLRKQQSHLDVSLLKGTTNKKYLRILNDHLEVVLDSFRPSLILYDAGVDVHEADRLGHLKLTDQGIMDRDSYVLNQAIRRGIPVAAVVGGGYAADLDELAVRHSILHRAATRVYKEKHL